MLSFLRGTEYRQLLVELTDGFSTTREEKVVRPSFTLLSRSIMCPFEPLSYPPRYTNDYDRLFL